MNSIMTWACIVLVFMPIIVLLLALANILWNSLELYCDGCCKDESND